VWAREGGCEAALAGPEVGRAGPNPGGGARDGDEWRPVAPGVPVGGRKTCTGSSSVRKSSSWSSSLDGRELG
jgi:hypothetical protein